MTVRIAAVGDIHVGEDSRGRVGPCGPDRGRCVLDDADDQARLLADRRDLVVDLLELTAAVKALEVGLERGDAERLVGLRPHLVLENLRVRIVGPFDRDEVELFRKLLRRNLEVALEGRVAFL